jgi:hypothetical protein
MIMKRKEEESDVPLNQSKCHAAADMFSNCLDMTRQFTEMIEDTKKQQLMSRT